MLLSISFHILAHTAKSRRYEACGKVQGYVSLEEGSAIVSMRFREQNCTYIVQKVESDALLHFKVGEIRGYGNRPIIELSISVGVNRGSHL